MVLTLAAWILSNAITTIKQLKSEAIDDFLSYFSRQSKEQLTMQFTLDTADAYSAINMLHDVTARAKYIVYI